MSMGGVGLGWGRGGGRGRNRWGWGGVPWEVTGPVVMLVSEGGRYVNGVDVVVDGGAMVF